MSKAAQDIDCWTPDERDNSTRVHPRASVRTWTLLSRIEAAEQQLINKSFARRMWLESRPTFLAAGSIWIQTMSVISFSSQASIQEQASAAGLSDLSYFITIQVENVVRITHF